MSLSTDYAASAHIYNAATQVYVVDFEFDRRTTTLDEAAELCFASIKRDLAPGEYGIEIRQEVD